MTTTSPGAIACGAPMSRHVSLSRATEEAEGSTSPSATTACGQRAADGCCCPAHLNTRALHKVIRPDRTILFMAISFGDSNAFSVLRCYMLRNTERFNQRCIEQFRRQLYRSARRKSHFGPFLATG